MILKITKNGELVCTIKRDECIEPLVKHYISQGYEVEQKDDSKTSVKK